MSLPKLVSNTLYDFCKNLLLSFEMKPVAASSDKMLEPWALSLVPCKRVQ